MEKLQKVYDIFVRDGHISDPAKTPFDKWAASFSDKPERQGELYDFLAEKKYVKQKPKDVWLGEAFGGATPTVVDQKKKTTPDQGVGSPVSQPQSKTASVVTPQSKPAVSPAKPTYLYGQEKEVVTPAAGENTPVPGLGGAPMEVKTTTVVEPLPPLQKEQEQATGMKEMFQKFQDYRNQATIAAQKNTMDEAAGNIEYKKSQRDPNPDWAEQQKYDLEDAQAAERAKVATTQPLVSKMLDYYDAKAGDTEWEDNRLVKALSYTSPPAAILAGGPGGMFAGDRDDSPVVALKEQLIGTPEGATLEQELQKIYKRTNLKDQASVDNALLDAKQLMFEKLADKDVQIWDDFAQTNKAMADYNPQAYHKRIESQIEKKYGMAGMDKDVAYNKLMDYSLNRGVMDEERTAEAKAVLNLRTLRDEVSRAEREGSVFRIDQAKQKLAAAEKEVQGMESQRLSALDKRVAIIQDLIVNETDQAKVALLKKDLDLAKAQRAGFINPNAQVMATYAKFQDQANAVAPKGTPMEKLQKLYAELEFDRQQIIGRIQKAEGGANGMGSTATDIARAGVNELINSVGGQGHNDDHKRLVQIESQIKDLAPIVFLNENPIVQDKKQGFFPAFNTGLMSSLAGQGSPLSNTQRQEDALSLARNLQLAGVTPEALNDPSMLGIKDRMEEPSLDSGEFIGSLAGASTGLMASIMATTALTKGVGLGVAINRAVTWGNKALGLTGKSGMILPLLGDAIESGINYEGAGRISVDNNDELSFLGGFLGGAAASATGGGTNSALNSFKKVVSKWFCDKGQEAVGLIVNFGASRVGSGTGELSEEFGQQIGQLWESSSTGQEFWKRMDEQFGTLDKATRFVVSTMVMGAFMGGAHSGGLGEYLTNLSKERLAALPPEQRPVVQEVVDQVAEEQAAFVEGGLNSTPEDVASVEAEQEPHPFDELDNQIRQIHDETDAAKEGLPENEANKIGAAAWGRIQEIRRQNPEYAAMNTEVEAAWDAYYDVLGNEDASNDQKEEAYKKALADTKAIKDKYRGTKSQESIEPEKKKELKPEAQAAQAELERRAAIDKTMVEQGLGDRVNTAQSQEDRLREERDALVAQQERQELTDNEKKRLTELETVVTGLDQIAAGEQFISPAPEVQAETETVVTNSGETIKPVEGSDTKKRVTLDVGGTPMEIEFDTEGLGEDLETFQSTLTPDAKDAFVESPAPTEETVAEENPFGEPTPREQPKRRDQQIVDQINEFFANLAGTIGENAVAKIKEYADRVIADPKARESIIKGLPKKWVDSIDEAVALQQQAPATDESIVDVTGEAKPAFNDVKPGDVVIYKGERTVVVSKGKSRGGNDVVTLRGNPRTLEEIKKDAIATIRQRHRAEYTERISDEQMVKNHQGEYSEIVSENRKTEATKSSTFTVDRESWDAETKKGEAPTPIAAEETVVATEEPMLEVNAVPDTRKKNDKAVAGGKSKPKANPNRKTKSKAVADLTPTEVVSEAIAVSAEVDENPMPENKDREAQIEERIEKNVVSPAPVAATPAAKGLVERVAKALGDFAESKTTRFFPDDQVVFMAKDGTETVVSFRGYEADGKKAIIFGKRGSGINQMQVDVSQIRKRRATDPLSKEERGKLMEAIDFSKTKYWGKAIPDTIPDNELRDFAVRHPRKGKESKAEARAAQDFGIATTPLEKFLYQEYGGDDAGINQRLKEEHQQSIENVLDNESYATLVAEEYAKAKENGTNPELVAAVESRIGNDAVTTEAEVVAKSPAPAQKPKKSRGKEKPLPEGVEDMFTEARVSGRRTSWMKKDGKWFFRNHKPGTKISEQQFERDWQEATGKDIERAERMAAMDPLTRELANSAKEWVAAWGDLVTLRNPYGKGDGKVFASVDLGIVGNSIKLGAKTAKVGINLARVLAQNGVYTYENWRNGMIQALGDHVLPFLDQAWESVKTIIPEGSTSADIQTNVVEEQANEKSQDVKKQSGRQATTDTMREFSETNPAALNAALASVDDTYEVMSIKGIFAEALAAVKKAGGFANSNVWADLLSEKEGEAKVLHHAKRMLAIRFYGELADQIQERMGDEATQEEMEAFEKAVSNMEVALDLVKNNNTWSGQQTSMMSEWRMVMANTVGYAKAKIEKYNAELLKSPKKGKAIKRKAKETKEQLNDIREQEGTTIDAAAAVDAAISDVENGTAPKAKKTREGGKQKTRIVKALGLNLEQANAMMEQARADMARAAREGFAGSMGSPAVFSFANALGRYGVAVMAKGAITFKEWAAKIKGDIPNVTDQQLQEAWDTHEHEGKTIAQHSKEALAAASAAPVKRTEARKQSLRGKIRGAINDHFKKGAEPMTLEERLLAIKDEAGNQLLTEDEAAHIYETVKDEFEARVKAKVEARAKALKRKPKKESKPAKTDSQRAIEAMVDGEFTDEMVQEIFADRLGLIHQMTTEQMKTARALGKALDSTKPNTRSEAQAAMALDRFMYEILPPPSNGELFGELFKSIIYANMLMGIPTHLKNLITSGAMTVSSFVETLGNLPKWKRAVRLAIKKGKETGDWKEASWLFLQASPFTELAVKTQALARGWSKGARIAWDIMKSGYIDSKYIDQGKAKLGRLSPILERHRFGKYNPANVFKYVGRALSAEDAWMYSINNEMELADATRRHFLDGKSGGPMTLTRDVSRRMAKSNPLYATSLTEAEADIDKISDALQMTPAEKARAIKIRAREILIDKIGLTEDEVQQAEDTARSRIFTMKRNGLWGKTATLMTKINNTKGIGKVSWIWMPFANIIGNLGDTFNDYYPGYGILRANGVSPTALTQMLGMNKESAMMSEPVQAEGTMDWIKKTWGGRQDQRYYEQMGRAWLGSMMMLTAMMLMDDDDKDDFIQFTGKNDPTHKNYLKIGGVPIISWELIPSIAPVAAIMSEAHSFHKLHPKEERSFGRRMLYAMGAVEQSVAGLSVAESAQNLNQVVGTALSSLTGVGNYGDPVDFEKVITTLGTELGKSGIGMLSRVNPLTNPLVGQIQQIFDPRVFSHSTIEQSMEYAALGATYRYTKDAEGNDRIAGVDIFGEEIKRLPSEDSFGFLSMFANEKAKDPRWKFLADHGGLEVMSRTTNANILFEDDEEKYGVVSRKMTDKQYGTYAKLAGQKFSKELTKYMNGNQWKKDYDTVVMGTAGTMTKLQEEVKKMASEARTKAKDEMDRMPESKGGFGGTRIGTKTYVKP